MADCTCTNPKPDGRGYCERCKGFACEYASKGSARCPAWLCDCFIEAYPDSPRGLHPGAFVVGGSDEH